MGAGKGGDDTTAVDAAAEAAIIARLEQLHADEGIDFHLVSEELGERTYGLSPNDARRRRPDRRLAEREARHPVLLGVDRGRRGPTMKDVVFGFVHDFGSGEEWTATRGEGAWLNGERLGSVPPKDEDRGARARGDRRGLDRGQGRRASPPLAHRLRVMGSLALSLCYLAAGRVDAGLLAQGGASRSTSRRRSCLLHEVGLPIIFVDAGPFEAAGPLRHRAQRAHRSPRPRTQELCERAARTSSRRRGRC